MKRVLLLLLTLGLLSQCTVEPLGTPHNATYTVTFTALWSAGTHPADFPFNPHFSGLIGAVHNDQVLFWFPGTFASPGIKSTAETGRKDPLDQEIEAAIAAGTAHRLISEAGLSPSPNTLTFEIEVNTAFPLVTIVSMLAPSPDWFVGVSGIQLFFDDQWADRVELPLFVHDAGTDSGATYTAANQVSDPAQIIHRIQQPPFFVGGTLPPVAQIVFERHIED